MSEVAIKIDNLKKRYRLGVIGGGTLSADLQSWWAKHRGKEDPNLKIGERQYSKNESFFALNDINTIVKKGETLGIIGSNGAGKSTLLKILSRVTAPTEGTVYLNGRISSMLEVGTGFHGELTGRENIYMNGAILGMTRKEVDAKLKAIIEFSECGQFIDTPVKRYSSGMYVKLAFAVAAHLDSEIMVMDEVLAVGDLKFQEKCLGKMGDAANNEGKTVLYVSHNMNTIRQLCNRCLVLNHGQIIFDGDVENAIEVYMDREKANLRCYYDLETAVRPSLDHGKKVFVNSFEFVDKDHAAYLEGQSICCKIAWSATQDISGLRLYIAVKYADETPVGVALSDELANAVAGREDSCICKMNFTNLAPGLYYFYINIVTMNEYGSLCSYDRPNQKIYFEVLPQKGDCGIDWKHKYMGSIKLNKIVKVG